MGGETQEWPVRTNPVNVVLSPGPRVQVRVVEDESGSPVREGRIVMAEGPGEWRTHVLPDGSAGATSPAPGDYDVVWRSGDDGEFFSMRQRVTLTEDHAAAPLQVTLRLPRRRWIEGRVVGEETETGLVGIAVHWQTDFLRDTSEFQSRTLTGRDGRFRLPVAPGNGYLLIAGEAAGFFVTPNPSIPRLAKRVDVPEDGDVASFRIDVPRGLTIRGAVRNADGEPVPQAVVHAESHPRRYLPPLIRETHCDGQGRFEISGLNLREAYDVSAVGQGGWGSETVAGDNHPFTPGDPPRRNRDVTLKLVLEPRVTLRGRVLLDGRPVSQVRMQLRKGERLDADSVRYRRIDGDTTDDDGRYELTGLQPGDLYQVEVRPPFLAVDPNWRHQSYPTLAQNAPREVNLPDVQLMRMTQSVSGIVVNIDGEPIEGIHVSAQQQSGGGLSRVPYIPPPWTETDNEGRFRLAHLPDQPLQLMAFVPPIDVDPEIRFPAYIDAELNHQDIRIVLDPSLSEEE